MALTALDKERVAVAISVAAGCRPCTTYHLAAARQAGVTDKDIEAAVAAAVCVRSSTTEGMRRYALSLDPRQDGCGCGVKTAWEELAALGTSLAVNCTENIAKHLAAVRALGVVQADLDEVAALTDTIRARAISHGQARFKAPGAQQSRPADACEASAAQCC